MPAVKKPAIILKEERIVKTLKKALIDKGWSVKHLAELCDMNKQVLSRTINHPMSVKLNTILTIADKLGIDSIPT